MIDVQVYGASDDLVVWEYELPNTLKRVPASWPDEDNVNSYDKAVYEIIHTSGDGTVRGFYLAFHYLDTGIWGAQVYQLEEDISFIGVVQIDAPGGSYSATVYFELPDDATIQRIV